MKRKPLHPRVHIIAGALITGVSGYGAFFGNLENPASMQLFFYIGLGILGYGLLKLVLNYIKSGKLKEDEERLATNMSGVPEARTYDAEYQKQVARQQALRSQQQPQIIACKLCNAKNYSTSNYCHMCGYKLR